jgi:DNA-binding response OmpR family regulator
VRALLRAGLGLSFTVSEAAPCTGLLALLDDGPWTSSRSMSASAARMVSSIAREIRAKHNVPIVMISGKGDTIDRVVGLRLGADDYIAKPFQMREVLARIRAVLRRYAAVGPESGRTFALPPEGGRFVFDGWTLDVARRQLRTPEGGVCELTTAEFNLLAVLLERPGRVLSRDEIMNLLKGHDWTPLDRTVDGLVARLRKKIERGECPELVKTVRGVGYVFAGEVRRI